jgi:hypothetical protein
MENTMSEHISFPSIGQFRDTIKHIISQAKYHEKEVPTVKFVGTVKLHGTNAGIVRPVNGSVDDIYFQSRERIIDVMSDNAGFAAWAYSKRTEFNALFESIKELFPDAPEDAKIQIYGEWAGSNIQKGVGICNIPKSLFVFEIRVSSDSASTNWLTKEQVHSLLQNFKIENVYSIQDFPTFEIDIDFNQPEKSQNILADWTMAVEKDCPVSRQLLGDDFASELIGEGIVFSAVPADVGFNVNGVRFKCKGEKHSSSKVKKVVTVDLEKVASIDEFVEYALTENRLKQGLDKLREMGLEIDTKNTGEYIKWCVSDSIKENLETLSESGLSGKDVSSKLSNKARQFFMNNME